MVVSASDPCRYQTFPALPDNDDVRGLNVAEVNLFAENTRIVLVIGNSLYCNSITDVGGPFQYIPANDDVHVMSLANGGIYSARDSLLNVNELYTDGACVLTTMGDSMITVGNADRVILAPVGVSGVLMSRFADLEDLGSRYIAMLQRLRAKGMQPTDIIIGGPNNEAFPGNEASVTSYAATLRTIISNLRATGTTAPIYLVQSNYIAHAVQASSSALLAAISSVVADGDARLGINTDDLGDDHYFDGTHLSFNLGRPAVAARLVDMLG